MGLKSNIINGTSNTGSNLVAPANPNRYAITVSGQANTFYNLMFGQPSTSSFGLQFSANQTFPITLTKDQLGDCIEQAIYCTSAAGPSPITIIEASY